MLHTVPTSICLIYIVLLFDYYLTKKEAEGDNSLYIKEKKKDLLNPSQGSDTEIPQ